MFDPTPAARTAIKVGVVQESDLRMSSLQKGGQIRAYRPVAPDSTANFATPTDDSPDLRLESPNF